MTNPVIEEQIAKTMEELRQAEKPNSRSRVWDSPRAYRFLVQWTNSVLLRILIRKFTSTFPKSEYRTKTQLDDAGRSVVSNIEEGFKRPTTSEYLTFLGYSQASLEEINGDINICGNPLNSTKLLYFPLDDNKGLLKEIRGEDLTYEMFRELINKTDWNLRRLVESLEAKQNQEQKFYQVEKARVWDKARGS